MRRLFRFLLAVFSSSRRTFAAIAAVLLVACLGWRVTSTWGYRSVASIYLTNGGQSCLVLRPGWFGNIHVEDGPLNLYTQVYGEYPHRSPTEYFDYPSQTQIDADFAFGRLTLRQSDKIQEHYGYDQTLDTVLMPSPTVPGDWDAVAVDLHANHSRPSLHDFPRPSLGAFIDPDELKEYLRNLEQWASGFAPGSTDPILASQLTPSQPPLRQFLHRVADGRLRGYFADRRADRNTATDLTLIRDIAASHPADPYLQMHRIEMEAVHGDLATAESLWPQWEPVFAEHPNVLLRAVSRWAYAAMECRRYDRDFAAVLRYSLFFAPPTPPAPYGPAPLAGDMRNRLAWLRALAATTRIQYLGYPLVPNAAMKAPPVNYVDVQNQSKAAITRAMMQGVVGTGDDGTLDLLLGTYRLGQSMNADGDLINRLFGAAIRGLTLEGLRIWALNAHDEPGGQETFLARFRETRRLDSLLPLEQPVKRDFFLGEFLTPITTFHIPNQEETQARFHAMDARAALVECAAAARLHLLRSGSFPASAEEFATVLPDGLGVDPFAPEPGRPLRWALDSDRFLLYSVGPDAGDDGGRLKYDPTNGTSSPGDITLTIPREREFPFPDAPIHASSAADLLAHYPHGLPPDSYSVRHTMSLAVVDSSTTRPVTILSVGPGDDRGRLWTSPYPGSPASPARWQPIYDYGRPFLRVSNLGWKEYDLADATTATVPGLAIPARRLPYRADPQYDPTNGASSRGDLLLELPR